MKHSSLPEIPAFRASRVRRGAHTIGHHALPVCPATGEARYRDRAQARDGLRHQAWTQPTAHAAAESLGTSLRSVKCTDCKGWHNLEEVVTVAALPALEPVLQPASKPALVAAPPCRPAVLHAIDIENQLVSKGRKLTLDDVKAWVEVYWNQGPGVREGDLVIVAVSPRSMWMLKAFTGKRIRAVIGHTGPDGADEALLAAIYVPDMSAQYAEWNIGSGDGAFTGLATQAAKRGVFVRMVTTGDTLIAPKLRRAVHVYTRIRTTSRTQTQAKQEHAATAIHAIRSASRVA